MEENQQLPAVEEKPDWLYVRRMRRDLWNGCRDVVNGDQLDAKIFLNLLEKVLDTKDFLGTPDLLLKITDTAQVFGTETLEKARDIAVQQIRDRAKDIIKPRLIKGLYQRAMSHSNPEVQETSLYLLELCVERRANEITGDMMQGLAKLACPLDKAHEYIVSSAVPVLAYAMAKREDLIPYVAYEFKQLKQKDKTGRAENAVNRFSNILWVMYPAIAERLNQDRGELPPQWIPAVSPAEKAINHLGSVEERLWERAGLVRSIRQQQQR